MKKLISIILSAVMFLSVTAIAAYAGNGPYGEPWKSDEGDEYYFAYAEFAVLNDDGTFAVDDGGMSVYKSLFSENEVKNEVPGAVYDRKTNTLTLTNFDQPNYGLELNMMGDDFTINVVGECALAGIMSYGDGWGCSVTVTGNGTLTLNEKLFFDHAVSFYAEGADTACLTVGPEASVHFYSNEGVLIADGVDENEEIIVLTREPSEQVSIKTEQGTYFDWTGVDVINVYDSPHNDNFLRINGREDDGIWCAVPTTWYEGPEGEEVPVKEGYTVYHFIKVESLGAWVVDIDAARDLGFVGGELDLSYEEFDALGFTVAKNGVGDDDWFSLEVYKDFVTNHMVYTDGEHRFIPMWSYDDEDLYYYTFKPVDGLDGIMITDSRIEPDESKVTFEVIEVPEEGYYIKSVENKELHIGKDAPVKPTATFKDVPAGEYYADAVAWAVRNGITAGTSATTFSPNDGCTRGQVVTFLWRSAGQPEPTSTTNPFKDVKADDYYYKAVLWAVEKGITMGTSNNTFSPNDTCTRGQIVTFMYRAKGSPAPMSGDNPFSDVKADDYFLNAVLWAVGKGITKGTSNTKFSPNDTCTRAQVVTFMYRGR